MDDTLSLPEGVNDRNTQQCACCSRGDPGPQGMTGLPGIQGLPGVPGKLTVKTF